MTMGRMLKYASLVCEVVFAIPLFGFVANNYHLAIPIAAIILHLTTLFFSRKEGLDFKGNIVGIVANIFGWIPMLAWGIHVYAAITLSDECENEEVDTTVPEPEDTTVPEPEGQKEEKGEEKKQDLAE